ncbi:uncharacterized protein LOC131238573 [Magnolia sinica]|uniref:uncharacterized protein LOC131238573 n=1 Tax=Magnolia sinica TaxID=86752 RepID=UPI0026581A19|nr:uncharacterized protein LOC131238573 [Magnolia sinica]
MICSPKQITKEETDVSTHQLKVSLCRSPGNVYVEGDASSMSYFLAGAAVIGGTVTVEGCNTRSLQDCLKFLKEIPSAATNDASANPFQHSSSVMNLYLETSSTLLKVLQAHSG